MKIKILLFEPNEILRVTLSEQLLIKKDYDVTLASSLQDFKWHAEKSMFDLLIMGEKEEVYTISSFVEFIKESQITNKTLFLILAYSILECVGTLISLPCSFIYCKAACLIHQQA